MLEQVLDGMIEVEVERSSADSQLFIYLNARGGCSGRSCIDSTLGVVILGNV